MQSSTLSPSKIAVAVVLAAGLCAPLLAAPPASATQSPIAVDTATKAVRVMWGASFSWEKIRALGGAAAALGAELLGVAAVKRGCFR